MALQEKITARSPVLISKDVEYIPPLIAGKKALRQEEVDTLKVEALGLMFDSGEASMDRMGRVMSVALWRTIKELADHDPAVKAIYDAVFKQNILWKTADNQVRSDVTPEHLAIAQEKGMYQMSDIYGKYG